METPALVDPSDVAEVDKGGLAPAGSFLAAGLLPAVKMIFPQWVGVVSTDAHWRDGLGVQHGHLAFRCIGNGYGAT